MKRVLSSIVFLIFLLAFFDQAKASAPTEILKHGQKIHDFTLEKHYTAGKKSIGQQWRHASGFKLYILQFDTVPQSVIWVGTPPSSNQGHPHALEHVLLGKSQKGRYLDMLETFTLSSSGALTYPMYTQYKFKTKAGMSQYYQVMNASYDALFNAKLDQDHIQQELYHFSVKTNQNNKNLSLVENGTVYQEMQSYEKTYTDYYSMLDTLLGDQHPYAKNSGGDPSSIRTLKPQAVVDYYKKYYTVGPNVSMLSFLPIKTKIKHYLYQLNETFKNLPQKSNQRVSQMYPIKAKKQFKEKIQSVNFASAQDSSSVRVRLAWDVVNNISYTEELMLSLFLKNLNDYIKENWIKPKKLRVETLSCYLSQINAKQFYPNCYATVSQKNNSKATVKNIQKVLTQSIRHFINLDAKPKLRQKYYAKARALLDGKALSYQTIFEYVPDDDAIESWKNLLEHMSFNKKFKDDIYYTDLRTDVYQQFLSSNAVWDKEIEKVGFLETPYIIVGKPSVELSKKLKDSQKQRIQEKLTQLKMLFKNQDDQKVLHVFAQAQQKKQKQPSHESYPKLLKNYAKNPDPLLKYKQHKKNGVHYVETYFKHKNSIDVNVLIRINEIPKKYHAYVGAIFYLLKRTGVYKNNRRQSYQDLADRWYKKGISMAYSFTPIDQENYFNLALKVKNQQFLKEAMQAWQDNLDYADFSEENLKELQYLIGKGLESSETLTQDPGDFWVPGLFKNINQGLEGKSLRYRISNYYSKRFDSFRLKWLLKDPVSQKEYVFVHNYFNQLLEHKVQRKADVIQLLKQKHPDFLLTEIANDLIILLENSPQATVLRDYKDSQKMVLKSLQMPVKQVLKNFKATLNLLQNGKDIKVVTVANKENTKATQAHIKKVLNRFSRKATPSKQKTIQDLPYFLKRMQDRYSQIKAVYPKHVFFETHHKSKANVKFKTISPGLKDTKKKSLIQYLSGNIFSGSGPDSFFYKTWQAGLAYGNGIAAGHESEKIVYVASRVGDLEALLTYVQGLSSRTAGFGQKELDLIYANYFNNLLRTDISMEDRAWSQAMDVFYKHSPKAYKKHAKKLIKLRQNKAIVEKIKNAWTQTWKAIWPMSLDTQSQQDHESVFLYTGDESDYQYIQSQVNPQTVYKIYPRDFWFLD